jgi:cell fate (sporulation/competence/biofilm development) regulator YmcA (YheA/YmcA/DUF963 family)
VISFLQAKTIFTHTQHLEEVSVFERTTEQFIFHNPDVEVIHAAVVELQNKFVNLSSMLLFSLVFK